MTMNARSLSSIALASFLVLTAACGSSTPAATTAAQPAEAFKRLTVEEVAARIAANDGKTFVFDDNNADRFAKGHVPGAKYLPYKEVAADKLPADKTAALVFYCYGEECSACHQAATAALNLGYTNVYIMPEGITGWEKKGQKVES
jgi:rhodanese-related sulfurtransferase